MKRFLLTFAVLACFGAYAVNHDISTGDLNITAGGSWEVTGSTSAYSITVQTQDPADSVILTLDNVTITSNTTSPVNILQGAVTVVLTGDNTLKITGGSDVGSPIRVVQNATLTIDGTGSLTASSEDNQSPAIGCGRNATMGEITINSGTIIATGGYYSSGIGSRGEAHITINGGNIKADGAGFGAGIGGHPGYVTINGGNVYARGAKGAAIGGDDEANGGNVTITGGTIYAKSDNGAGVGNGCGNAGHGDSPYVYISGGSLNAISVYGEAIGRGKDAAAAGRDFKAPLTEENGAPVYKATVSGAIVDHTRNYAFTTTRNGSAYGYTYSGSGYVSGGVFSSTDDNLYFYLPNGEYGADSGLAYFTGTVENADTFLTKTLVGTVTLSIAQGDVTFTSFGVSGKDANGDTVEGEYAEYDIIGSSSDYVVSVEGGTHNIVLNGASITTPSKAAISIASGCNVILGVEDSNTLTGNGLFVDSGAYLTIQGTGSLAVTGDGWNVGIGGASANITINSGTIEAHSGAFHALGGNSARVVINGGTVKGYAGSFGAGIGGNPGNVTITGGNVYGQGDWKGAGIGGGDDASGGTVTITGGTVEGRGGNGAGIGNGEAGNASLGDAPYVYISGGSVLAYSSEAEAIGRGRMAIEHDKAYHAPQTGEGGEAIHLATLPDAMVTPSISGYWIMGSAGEVTFTTQRNKAAYDYTYTGTGYADNNDLYFYLPDGSYVIEGTNGKSMGGTINGADATFTVVPEPALFGFLAILALCFRRK